MYRTTTFIAATLATTGIASAGGPAPAPIDPVIAPAPIAEPAPIGWGGGYAGAQLGYGTGDFTTDLDDYDSDGVIGGFHAGYLWNFGGIVVGPELQYDFADLDISSGTGAGNIDEIARLNLRVGRELGRGLIYGSAGVAYANFDGVSGALSGDLDDAGYTLGIGYDYLLTDRWVVGGQYQYHEFDDFGAAGNDFDFGTVHLRASYQF